ncbi:hypothetical protein [Cytobacillus firmus]|uniref:hypothetical protein n=1 Tax=Cytobacillus firmus TaxID=1399 RepID=UPI0024C1CE76|nr:hypothetical protein [Cytobacillus firmus]WHY59894.1 hypothetical protein QNH42_15020 [Cytobacillus firmus]
MKKILLLSAFFILLFNNMVSTPIQADQEKQTENIEKSASDKGITFKVNSYEKKDGKLTIHYTVTSDHIVLRENQIGNPFMEKPWFYINNKRLNVWFDFNQTKVNNHKFTGYVSISLDDIKSEHHNFTFKIDSIAGQGGNWKVNFNI